MLLGKAKFAGNMMLIDWGGQGDTSVGRDGGVRKVVGMGWEVEAGGEVGGWQDGRMDGRGFRLLDGGLIGDDER